MLALATTALLAVAGCGDDEGEGDTGGASEGGGGLPASVSLGFLNSLTGEIAFCGEQEKQGADLAIKEANESNFLGDTEVSLTVADDRSTPDGAVTGARKLINEDVPVIVGPCLAALASAVAPIAEQSKVPIVLTSAGATDITGDFTFRAGVNQNWFAGKVVDVLEAEGVEKVGVIYDGSNGSIEPQVWSDTQKPALGEAGIEIVAEENVQSSQPDFSSQVSKVLAAKPDAVGILVVGPPNLTMVRQLREAGFDGPVWGQIGLMADFYFDGGPATDGTYVAVGYSPGIGGPSSDRFTEAFKAEYGADVSPTSLTSHGYDAVWMALNGLKNANSVEPEAVQEGLANLDTFDGAQGQITVNEEGDAVAEGGVVVIEDGEPVPVESGN